MTVGGHQRFAGVDALLADARSRLERVTPSAVAAAVADGALLVDIRPAWQRLAGGEIPGSLVVDRNHLEWRLDPTSDARVEPAIAGQVWIVICAEGYTSSLAADSLQSIGVPATDVEGGFEALVAAGFQTVTGGTEPGRFVVAPAAAPA